VASHEKVVRRSGPAASHFWINTYDGMLWSAGLAAAAVAWVGWRAWAGLPGSAAPGPVALHVRLAFFNFLAAAAAGILLGVNRTRGFVTVSPLALLFGHIHLAAVGWATMMVVGLAYRLIPMMLPAAIPTGRALAVSAILIEAGLAVLFVTLLAPHVSRGRSFSSGLRAPPFSPGDLPSKDSSRSAPPRCCY
jgi:hypothetical protein